MVNEQKKNPESILQEWGTGMTTEEDTFSR